MAAAAAAAVVVVVCIVTLWCGSGEIGSPVAVDVVLGEEHLHLFERRLPDVGHDEQHEQVAEHAEDGVEPEGARQVHGRLHVAETGGDDERRPPEEGGDHGGRHALVVVGQDLAEHQPRQRAQSQSEGARVHDDAADQDPFEAVVTRKPVDVFEQDEDAERQQLQSHNIFIDIIIAIILVIIIITYF